MGLEGSELGGRYRLMERLGAGAMATVYRARHVHIPATFAVKVLEQGGADREARFLREAQMAARVYHPGVVRVFDVGKEASGPPFIVMELLVGETLEDRMRRAAVSCALALRLAVDLLDALAACHRLGLVHRDIKPSNLFVARTPEGPRLKLLDFGVAKLSLDEESPLTGTGVALGTLSYMAPEQIRGSRDVDLRCDIFAVAAILFRLLTRESHMLGGSPGEIVAALMTHSYRRHIRELDPALPEWLDAAVARALDPEIEPRYPSCDALMKALLKGWGERLPSLGELEPSARQGQPTVFDGSLSQALTTWEGSGSLDSDALIFEDALSEAPTTQGETRGYPGQRPPRDLLQRTFLGGGLALDTAADVSLDLAPDLVPIPPTLAPPPAEARTQVQDTAPLTWSGLGRSNPVSSRSCRRPLSFGQRSAVAGLVALLVGASLGIASGRGRIQRPEEAPSAQAVGPDRPDRADRIAFPGGAFIMGSSDAEIQRALAECQRENGAPCPEGLYRREAPQVVVTLAPFALDRDEVSVGDVADWLSRLPNLNIEGGVVFAGADPMVSLPEAGPGLRWDGATFGSGPEGRDAPMAFITQLGAAAFCRDQGKRLPTEAEWAFAARGRERRTYPWGEGAPTCAGVSFGREPGGMCGGAAQPSPVGTHPQDVTPEGVRDLGGGVMEWTADGFAPDLGTLCPGGQCADPRVEPVDEAAVRGGAALGGALLLRAGSRSRGRIDTTYSYIGFRCAEAGGPKEETP